MILAPDTKQRFIYADDIAPNLKAGDAIFFGHGFNIRYDLIKPPADVDVAMVAPKGPGHLVRRQFVDGKGVPCLIAVEQDAEAAAPRRSRCPTRPRSAARGRASSRRRSPRRPRPTSSASRPCSAAAPRRWCRPASRCSPRPATRPEIAYFECLHELKLIVDLMYEGGIANERFSISDTAEYGDLTRGPRVITSGDEGRDAQDPRARSRTARFAREWVAEDEAGRPNFTRLQKEGQEHPIEQVGEKLRGLMSWVGTKAT